MMRVALVVLLLANAGYFSWAQGHWVGLGGAGSWADPAPLREPQRLDLQLQPERLVPLRPQAPAAPIPGGAPQASAAAEAPATDVACLRANLPSDEQATAWRLALVASGLPESSWQLNTALTPARWVVYLGKFASADALRARKAELREAKVDHRDTSNPTLQPGLVLGTFPTEAAAAQGLRDMVRQGIKTAKVVSERPEIRQHALTLPQAPQTLQDTVRGLGTTAGLSALDWDACGD